jgi:hypothetical protein
MQPVATRIALEPKSARLLFTRLDNDHVIRPRPVLCYGLRGLLGPRPRALDILVVLDVRRRAL